MNQQYEYEPEVKLSCGSGDGEDTLHCPVCGFDYIHHGKVVVWDRFGEDKNGLKVEVLNGVKATPVSSEDIPGRRDSLDIYFSCEQGCKSVLRITQHKGNTFLSWVRKQTAEEVRENANF